MYGAGGGGGLNRSHRSEIATLNRPFCGVGALPLTQGTAPHDNWDIEFRSIFLHEPPITETQP